jgi:ribosomal protein L32
MSLARAVTKRMKRSEVPSPPNRSQSVKNPTTHIDRAKISLPVALVSTTNMLSYNAPDIATMRHVSSSTASTHSSADDSDHSASTTRSRASTVGSRDTALTDSSSVESSPTSPAPNHLSGYFPPTGKQLRKSVSSTSLHRVKEETVETIPAIPQRALSHSKRAHERLAAKRSLQTINSRGSTGSLRHSREHRSSVDMFSATIVEETHPFGRELEQLNEIVEEFGGVVRDAETEADLTVMRSRNLAAFCAADYLSDIRPLFSSRFGIPQQAPPMAWI